MRKALFALICGKAFIKCACMLTMVSMALAACAPGTALETVTESIPSSATNTSAPTETATPTLAHPEFSANYQPEFAEHYVAEIYGMEIPIDIGLTHLAMTGTEYPISAVHIAEDVVPILGDMWLDVCHYRYTHFMGEDKANITFKQYIELVRLGEGNIEFAVYDERLGGGKPVVMEINPIEGFAISLVRQGLPIKINDLYSMYYGTAGSGKLFIAEYLDTKWLSELYGLMPKYSAEELDTDVFSRIYIVAFGDLLSTENRCIQTEDVQYSCGYPAMPDEWANIEAEMIEQMKLVAKKERGSIFEVVEK